MGRKPIANKKDSTSFSLSETAKRLLFLTKKKMDINQTAILEIAIRLLAKKEGIKESDPIPPEWMEEYTYRKKSKGE